MTGVAPWPFTPRRVRDALRERLADGARLHPAGEARDDPEAVLVRGYAPRYALRLFDTTFFLTSLRREGSLRFFVAFLHRDGERRIHPRILYKDVALIWRVASHYIRSRRDHWIGKGEVRWRREDGTWLREVSAEETTNLPLEIQPALDLLNRRVRRGREDPRALPLFLRRAPDGRLRPYADFVAPRRRAREDPGRRVNRGRPVARFLRPGDPASLRFAPGYAPDWARGVLEASRARSRLYGGPVRKLRLLSRNRRIQYQLVATPRHCWLNPPQALDRELTSYGVRAVDVEADEDLFVPGYEWHYRDATRQPSVLHSQIPDGFAGAQSRVDPSRADASAWQRRLPFMREAWCSLLGRAWREPPPLRGRGS